MKSSDDIMTENLVTIKAESPITMALELMNSKSIRHLPVVDDRNKIVGILSDRDVQRAMSVKKINQFQQQIHLDAEILVEDFMSWPVYSVNETTPIVRVAEEMLSQKVSSFLVEDNAGKIKGIITTDDMLKVLIMEAQDEKQDVMKSLSYYFTGPELY
jgi:acetoin utilization protein AcuB